LQKKVYMILEKKMPRNWYILSVLVLVLAMFAACEKAKSPASGTASTSGAANSAGTEAAKAVEQVNAEAVQAVEQASAQATQAVEAAREAQAALENLEDLSAALNAASSLADIAGSSSSSSGGDRKAIDDFLKSCEAFVAEAKKAESSNDPMAKLPLITKSTDLATKAAKLQNNTAWTVADSTKYATLLAQASKALQ
jgi:hypothetical protein